MYLLNSRLMFSFLEIISTMSAENEFVQYDLALIIPKCVHVCMYKICSV